MNRATPPLVALSRVAQSSIQDTGLPMLEPFIGMGGLAVGMAAIVMAVMCRKEALAIAAADAILVTGWVLARREFAVDMTVLWPIVWTAVMVAIGYGFEPYSARLGIRLFRLDRTVLMGAAIGMVVALFATPMSASGLTMKVVGAFLGALAGGLFSGVMPKRALIDALGALLGLFGADGIRLMATLSVVALVVQGAALAAR